MSKLWTPNSTKPGATIAGLVLPCAQCQQAVDPHEFIVKEGLCIRCLCDRRCAPLRDELVRLYRKREQLIRKFGEPNPQREEGKPLQYNPASRFKSNDEQAQRVRVRIIKYVAALTADQKLIDEIVNRQGQLAREAALANSRIKLLPFGTPAR